MTLLLARQLPRGHEFQFLIAGRELREDPPGSMRKRMRHYDAKAFCAEGFCFDAGWDTFENQALTDDFRSTAARKGLAGIPFVSLRHGDALQCARIS
jgi:hypothetical protein